MQSKAATVDQYLAEIPEDRRSAISAVRAVLRKNLDKDIEEGMSYGMIGYAIPHRVFPAGYHCDPKQGLPFAAIASQKNYMSVYLMTIYGEGSQESWFREAWAKTGKKLDMGKCCIRFKKLEDLALDVIGEAVRRVSAKDFITHYTRALATTSKPAAAKRGARKAAARPVKEQAKKVAKRSTVRAASKKTAKKAAKRR